MAYSTYPGMIFRGTSPHWHSRFPVNDEHQSSRTALLWFGK